MSTEQGDGFFGSIAKNRKRDIIRLAIAAAYDDGLRASTPGARREFPMAYAEKKMVELEKKLNGRPW